MATTEQLAISDEPLGDVPDKPEPQSAPQQKEKTPAKHAHSPLYWIVFLLVLLGLALLVFFFGYLPRHKRKQEIDKQAKDSAQEIPKVRVLKVQTSPATTELLVPGTTQAYTEATIYARSSGYVTRRLVDIGDHVHAGQLLAVIDAPDLDKQVAQARSSLAQSQSNLGQLQAQLHLADLTWQRWKVLVAKGVFSRQDGDTQEANFRVAEANVGAGQSTVQANRDNLERLIVLQQYERVTAPFSGTVTARNVDVGTLITAQGNGVSSSSSTLPGTTQSGAESNNAGSSGNVSSSVAPSTGGSQGGALFSIADTTRFRVLVSVPEAYTSLIRAGQEADLLFQEVPNERFVGHVTRTSASIDSNTRTLLVEVQVFNHAGKLMPGMFAQVNLIQMKAAPPLLIPGESIVVRNGKNMVAAVENNYVHFLPITIGRDYGNESEIIGGLTAGELIAVDVSDQVREGVKVDPQLKQDSQSPGGQSDQKPNTAGQYGNQNLSNQGGKQAAQSKGGNSGKGGSAGKSK